jgi:hypothetical protein
MSSPSPSPETSNPPTLPEVPKPPPCRPLSPLPQTSNPPEASTIPQNRAKGRDVHIFNASDPNTELGGLILTNGVTNANLYAMVEIVFIVTSKYFLQDAATNRIEKDDHPLKPGNYYIVATSKF